MEQICIYLAMKAFIHYLPDLSDWDINIRIRNYMRDFGRPVFYAREDAPPRSISALYYHYLDTYPPLRVWTKREFEA